MVNKCENFKSAITPDSLKNRVVENFWLFLFGIILRGVCNFELPRVRSYPQKFISQLFRSDCFLAGQVEHGDIRFFSPH